MENKTKMSTVDGTCSGFRSVSDNKKYSLNTLLERGPVVAAFSSVLPGLPVTFPFSNASTALWRDGRNFSGYSQTTRAPQDFARISIPSAALD